MTLCSFFNTSLSSTAIRFVVCLLQPDGAASPAFIIVIKSSLGTVPKARAVFADLTCCPKNFAFPLDKRAFFGYNKYVQSNRPVCRNRQTRQTQNLLSARVYGFKSHHRHYRCTPILRWYYLNWRIIFSLFGMWYNKSRKNKRNLFMRPAVLSLSLLLNF